MVKLNGNVNMRKNVIYDLTFIPKLIFAGYSIKYVFNVGMLDLNIERNMHT